MLKFEKYLIFFITKMLSFFWPQKITDKTEKLLTSTEPEFFNAKVCQINQFPDHAPYLKKFNFDNIIVHEDLDLTRKAILFLTDKHKLPVHHSVLGKLDDIYYLVVSDNDQYTHSKQRLRKDFHIQDY